MHGRVKSVEREKEEKKTDEERREDLAKVRMYHEVAGKVLALKKQKLYEPHVLPLTSHLLLLNPEFHMVWSYRREVIDALAARADDPATEMQEIAQTELKLTLVRQFGRTFRILCARNCIVLPDPLTADVLFDEIGTVQQAVFTEPDDQSAWFYYRWLLTSMMELVESSPQDAAGFLRGQVQWMDELIEMETDAKWVIVTLADLHYRLGAIDSVDGAEEAKKKSVDLYQRAVAIDPDHRRYYEDMAKKNANPQQASAKMQQIVAGSRAVGRQWRRLRPSCLSAAVAGSSPSILSPQSVGGWRAYPGATPLPSPSRMSVADLLDVSKQFRSKETNYILEDQTLDEAVKCLAQNKNSATLVVVNKQQQVVGLLTNRLALERVVRMRATGKRSDWNLKVSELAIPVRKILHVSPEDSLEDVLMALSGVGELPVLQGDKLLGTVSLTDIASLLHRHDAQLNPSPTSAKSDYINLILPRKGLPANTSLDQNILQNSHASYWPFYLHSFAMSIPHPAKKETGGEDAFFLGVVAREEGEDERADVPAEERPIDIEPSISTVTHGTQGPIDVLAMGVADGVGSWFEKGVSARLYAQELMTAAHQAVQISYTKNHDIDPAEVLHAAWSTVLQKEIIGSSTACVLALDPELGELHGVNLGDSGFLIIRDKMSDRETARLRGTLDGSLMRKIANREQDLTPAGRRKGAHVSYRSPQQLHYFNCPFQLGFAGAELAKDVAVDLSSSHSPMSEKPLFETPDNGMRLRVPVLEGDLIILATDGLFDNVDEDVLLEIVRAEPDLEAMTRKLVQRAYDLSLDRMRDSPFARLAKENDLLWGGGMPDDITIIAARVTKHKTPEEKVAEAEAAAAEASLA
ncbi:hypothetical protein BBJ28_00008930 [Nothophytophthora sp. Chile5]|nr:hypothetical protein BBJ28_00008930 [Nothophytophthora sp. Chile5]